MNTQTLKPSDLRIGNKVDIYGSIATVQAADFSTGIAITKGRPIPLTEEWLLKLGFYKSIENAGNLQCYKKRSLTAAKWINDKWQVWIDSKDLRKSPQYVHQLQNLYFALTGEELEIKI